MQLMCLKPNINTLISIILGGVVVLALIEQVDGNIPFQQYYYRACAIDLGGYIKGQLWFPKYTKYYSVGANGEYQNEQPDNILGEHPQQPHEQSDQPQSEEQEESPYEQPDKPPYGQPDGSLDDPSEEPLGEQMDDPPEAEQDDASNNDSGEPSGDNTDMVSNVPMQSDSNRWPYECPKGHPEPTYMSETCFKSVGDGSCKLCADGAVLLCCTSVISSEVAKKVSVETMYLQMSNGGTRDIFQNITARKVYVKFMQTAIEEGAFIGSENIEILQITNSHFGHMKRMDLIFEGLYKLKALYLDDNGITMWDTTDIGNNTSDKGLQVLPSLEILTLKKNLFETLGSNFFEWLQGSQLRYLNLEGCNKILMIDPGVLLPVSGSLWILELAHTSVNENNLINILSSNLTELKALGLKSIGLKRIPRRSLEMVNGSLEVLSLQDNHLTSIYEKSNWPPPPGMMHEDIFPYMPKLKELSLANCEIETFSENIFHNLEDLRKLLIHQNTYSEFRGAIFRNLKKLKYLNMRYIASEADLQIDFSGLNDLEILDASYTRLPLTEKVFSDLSNLKELLLKESGVLHYEPTVSKCFTNLEVLDLSGNEVLCDHFHEIFEESLNLSKLAMSNCQYSGMKDESIFGFIRKLKLLKVLYLANNKFTSINELKFTEDLLNLETLNINKNKLVSWDDYAFSNNLKLKNVFVASNEIASISRGMMMTFVKLDLLDASYNPYLCYCSLTHFNEFAQILKKRKKDCNKLCIMAVGRKHQKTSQCLETCREESEYNEDLQQMIDYVNNSYKAKDISLDIIGWSDGAYQCLDNSGRTNIQNFQFENWQCFTNEKLGYTTPEEQIMSTWKIIVIVVSCVIVLMLGICYWKWRYIYQFGRAIRSVTLLRLLDDETDCPTNSEDNVGSAYSYDVFISYSEPNRQWVLEELVPNFETGSDLKVCLHERDFQVGLSILENIISCMDQSRSILLVLSQAFLRSQWCQFELHMAQHRLLETRREDLILVLLEEIPTSRRPKMLRYLMLTKTYIQWPGYDAGAEELKLFWKRLRRAVLLPRVTQNQDTMA